MSVLKSVLKIVPIVAAMTFISAASVAGEGKGHKGGDMAPMDRHFSPENMKQLGLSSEQKDKLKDIRKSHRDDGKKIHEEMKAARKAFKEALKTDASKEDVTKAFDAMMAKKSELAKARFDGLLEAREVLTKEQRAKLFDKEE